MKENIIEPNGTWFKSNYCEMKENIFDLNGTRFKSMAKTHHDN